MSTQVSDVPSPQPERIDAQITASIKGLAAALDVRAEELAELAGITRATYYRRRHQGGWKAAEVALIAHRFRVDVADIYSGKLTATVTTRAALQLIRGEGRGSSFTQPPLVSSVSQTAAQSTLSVT